MFPVTPVISLIDRGPGPSANHSGLHGGALGLIITLIFIVVWVYLLRLGIRWIKEGKRKVWGWALVLLMILPFLASIALAMMRVMAQMG